MTIAEERTSGAGEATKDGWVVAIAGPVIDVEFATGSGPSA
jgi:hypothetical protein